MVDPDKAFDEYDRNSLFCRIDRVKTLEEIRRLNSELESKMPENSAGLVVINGEKPQYMSIGVVSLRQTKAKDRVIIERTKKDLIEKLKAVDGPCLSFDAPSILAQACRLYFDAGEIVQKYGDIITSPT